MKKGQEYATLTDVITQGWSGMKTRQYKQYKGLKTESLRDNMTNLELVLNMLAEASTTEISKEKQPRTIAQNRKGAAEGGSVAAAARKTLETRTGKKVVLRLNAKQVLAAKQAEQIEATEDNNIITPWLVHTTTTPLQLRSRQNCTISTRLLQPTQPPSAGPAHRRKSVISNSNKRLHTLER